MSLQTRFEAAMMPTYAPALALIKGRGSYVWDDAGNRYLDLLGGIAVSSLGHAHPALVEAVSKQVATLAHTSNLYVHEPGVALAERLLGLLGTEGRVFFCNSGAEANEAALKLVRKHAGPDRPYVVAADKSFHGRTLGALAITGKASIRDPFGPFGINVKFVPYGDADALREAVTDETAALFLEPTLGEGGVVPPPDGYLRAAREVCDATGAALVLDEIQSGIGRTGAWLAHQHEGVPPDVLTLAKGLGGGLPIGACIGIGEYGTVFAKGDHGSTFGANPVATAAALAVIDTIERDGLLDNVAKVGEQLASGIAANGHPLVAGVRGSGLWLALQLRGDHGISPSSPQPSIAAAVEAAARNHGFLVNAVAPDAIRLAPPLILSATEAESFLDALPAILEEAAP